MPTHTIYPYIELIDDEVEVEVGYHYQHRQVGDYWTEPIEPYIEIETYSCLDPRITPEVLESCLDDQEVEEEIWQTLEDERIRL